MTTKRSRIGLTIDSREFSIGDVCVLWKKDPSIKYIIQGVDKTTPEHIQITLGNLDMDENSQLMQLQVDSREIETVSLPLHITIPEEEENDPPHIVDIDRILKFFGREAHTAFKQAFIKFCHVFNVPYVLARPLFITRVLSWDLHEMFEKNERAWLIPRTGRMYVERSIVDVFSTPLGNRTITFKPKVVSSEVAMLTHQRKIIDAAVDSLSVEQLDVLRMSPLSHNLLSKKSRKSKSASRQKTKDRIQSRRMEYNGYGMIDFQEDIEQVKRVVAQGLPVKLQIIPLGGRVIGAHKNQVTDINLLNHAEQALMKQRRIGGPERQPIMSGELDTLAKLSLVQVIPSTNRFNLQHLTDQLIPAKDKTSQSAYERMVMCILANEYLTDVSYPLADVIDEDIHVTFNKFVFALMYSDLELRLQLSQDPETSDRSLRHDKTRITFIREVGEMNIRRNEKSSEMKDPEVFNAMFQECMEHLPDDKHAIETRIRDFFTEKLKEWGIRVIPSIKPTRDESLHPFTGSIHSYLKENPHLHASELLSTHSLTKEQIAKVSEQMKKRPREPVYAKHPVKEDDAFIHEKDGIFIVVNVDGDDITIRNVYHPDFVTTIPMHFLQSNYISLPKEGSVYQHADGTKFTVSYVKSSNDIGIQVLNESIGYKVDYEYLRNSIVLESSGEKRPTKRPTKRRNKRRNTRKGG